MKNEWKKNKNHLLSTGEFAKLNSVNKRTLHYYNDIGLFCPEFTDENGYHYYSSLQSIQLEMILMLRKIGLSIEEIRACIGNPVDHSFSQVFQERKYLIDKSIRQLTEAKEFLQQKLDKMELGLSVVPGKIEEIYLPEQRMLLSKPITGAYDEDDFAIASEFSLRLKQVFGLYDNFGSRIAVSQIEKGNFEKYDAFFAYGRNDIEEYDMIRPAGKYLRVFGVGGWEELKRIHEKLLNHAKEHQLRLMGYVYEEGINEMALQKSGDYITMITVAYDSDMG